MRVDKSPIAQLHQLVQAPEDLLLVVRDVKEEQTDDVVHALDVAHLVIVISIGLEYVKQLIIALIVFLLPKVQVA